MEGTTRRGRDLLRVIELGAAADLELVVVHVVDAAAPGVDAARGPSVSSRKSHSDVVKPSSTL